MTVRDLTVFGCSSQQPTRYRNHGGYLLRWNEEGFLIDPGEGTQRQFIYANVAPPTVTRILISHFHGDHCLGLGSMLMRLNLDDVQHPIHCYYPASGKIFFDRLRFGTAYHDKLEVIEHPVSENGLVHDDGEFKIEAAFLDHRIDNVGWRITESDERKYIKNKLEEKGVKGPKIRELMEQGSIEINGKKVFLEEVSYVRPGDSFASVIDTRPCQAAIEIAQNASMLLSESTYLERDRHLAHKNYHLTATDAANMAKEACVGELILTHFSARYLDLEEFKDEARQIFPKTEIGEDLKVFPFPKTQRK